jgi:hypothetical protein
MHEVAASRLISEVRIGTSAGGLCLRLSSNTLPSLLETGAASLSIVIAADQVRLLPVQKAWVAADSIVEVEVPFARLGAGPGSDIQFAVQVRDQSDAVLESLPHGRYWTIAVPKAGLVTSDWQA